MCQWVKLSIQLAHGDGLGVEDVGVHSLKGHSTRGALALQGRQGLLQDLIALHNIHRAGEVVDSHSLSKFIC